MSERPLERVYPPGPDHLVMPIYPDRELVNPVVWEEGARQQRFSGLVPYDVTYNYGAAVPSLLVGNIDSYITPKISVLHEDGPPQHHLAMRNMNMGHNRQIVQAVDKLLILNQLDAYALSVSGLELGIRLRQSAVPDAGRSIALQFLCKLGKVYGEVDFHPLPPPPKPNPIVSVRRRLFNW